MRIESSLNAQYDEVNDVELTPKKLLHLYIYKKKKEIQIMN